MKNLIISFKSRNELYSFANILKRNGIFTSIINTPKSIGSSCMLSLKTDLNNLNSIRALLQTIHTKTFLGVFLLQSSPSNQTTRLM